MSYRPSKKETKQIENLNRGYQLIKDGLKLIKANLPKRDGDIEMQAYKMSRNFDKIIIRIKKLLEKQYIDNQFIDIINNRKIKDRPDRFDKRGNKKNKRIGKSKKNKKG